MAPALGRPGDRETAGRLDEGGAGPPVASPRPPPVPDRRPSSPHYGFSPPNLRNSRGSLLAPKVCPSLLAPESCPSCPSVSSAGDPPDWPAAASQRTVSSFCVNDGTVSFIRGILRLVGDNVNRPATKRRRVAAR